MKKNSFLKWLLFCFVLLPCVSLAAYASFFIMTTDSSEGLFTKMKNESTMENPQFTPHSIESIRGKFFIPWVASNGSDFTEAYIVKEQSFLNLTFFDERYKLLSHYSTNEPIGIEKVALEENDDRLTAFLLYSPNNMNFDYINVEITNRKTGAKQNTEYDLWIEMPFACFIESDTENFVISSVLCYNDDDQLVYEYQI